jgi:serine/threonine-protein kinase
MDGGSGLLYAALMGRWMAWLSGVALVCTACGGNGNGASGNTTSSGGGGTGASSGGGGSSNGGGGSSNGGGGTSAGGGGAGGAGPLAHVGACGKQLGRYFPGSAWMYQDVTKAPVRKNSDATTKWLEDNGSWGYGVLQIDTAFVVLDADASTPRVTRTPDDPVEYSTDCDPDVKFPIPPGGHLEGEPDYVCPGRVDGDYQGDCHLLVSDLAEGKLFESFRATYANNKFYSECTIEWDANKDLWGEPPASGPLPAVADRNWGIGRDCTSTDAAGFPIAPLLFNVEEVKEGRIEHAIRFILPNQRMQLAPAEGVDQPVYVWPATHAGGPSAVDPNAPIYGSRWRLKADFDPAKKGLDPNNQVVKAVVYGLKKYGMLLADGGNIALTAEDDGACDTKWADLWGDKGSKVLAGIEPSDFEIIDTGDTDAGFDCVRTPR